MFLKQIYKIIHVYSFKKRKNTINYRSLVHQIFKKNIFLRIVRKMNWFIYTTILFQSQRVYPFNSLIPNATFLHPLKSSENLKYGFLMFSGGINRGSEYILEFQGSVKNLQKKGTFYEVLPRNAFK